MTNSPANSIFVSMPDGFSLARTCAPAAWANGRWPNEDWIEGAFWWAGRDGGASCWRCVRPTDGGVIVEGTGDPALFPAWTERVLAPLAERLSWNDPVIAGIHRQHPGAGSLNSGNMADGAIFAIVGQSVSLASAGVTATRLAARFHPGFDVPGRVLWPLPDPRDLAVASWADIRASGVTGKRAEAIIAAARLFAEGSLPEDPCEFDGAAADALLRVVGVGPWTVASTLLWGGGARDVFPPGDAALLRAARAAYREPEMNHRDLEARASTWKPYQAIASRLLWLDLFGHPGDLQTAARPARLRNA
jgi:DNA-3-methyladenine glycosylase II